MCRNLRRELCEQCLTGFLNKYLIEYLVKCLKGSMQVCLRHISERNIDIIVANLLIRILGGNLERIFGRILNRFVFVKNYIKNP